MKKGVEYGSSDRAYKNMSKWNKNGTVYKMITSREEKYLLEEEMKSSISQHCGKL